MEIVQEEITWTPWTHEDAEMYSADDLRKFRQLSVNFIKNNPTSDYVPFCQKDLIDLDAIIADRKDAN